MTKPRNVSQLTNLGCVKAVIKPNVLYLCSRGDKPTFARLLLWAVTKPSNFGPW